MGLEEDIREVAEGLAEDLYAGDPAKFAGARAAAGDQGPGPEYNTVTVGASEMLAGGMWNGGPLDKAAPADGPDPAVDGQTPIMVLLQALALVALAERQPSAPSVTDDESKGYRPGKLWVDTSVPTFYGLVDATTGAAVWVPFSGGGGGSGTVVSVNGVSTGTAANLQVTTPVAPADGVNVRWDKSGAAPTLVSANVPVDNATIVPSAGKLAVGAIAESQVTNLLADLSTLASAIAAISTSSIGAVPTSRTLTGSGAIKVAGDNAAHDLSANRTISVAVDGTTVVQTGNQLAVGAIAESQVTNLVADLAAKANASTTLTGTAPITVAGDNAPHDLSANRTIAVDDATTGAKGVVQLAGDLAGTAALPVIGTNKVTDAKFRQGAATSVVGRAANSTGNVADIAAVANDTFFGRMANALGFFTFVQILATLLTAKGDLITFDTAPVKKAVSGNNGAMFTETSNSATGNDWLEYTDPGFGDGNDGNITYSGATTLTEPVNAVNVTINSGVRVETGGFIIRGKGILTFTDATSIISHNGGDALVAVAGVGASGGQLGGGASGLAGSTFNTVGTNGTAQANSWGAMTGGGTTSDGGAGGAAGFAGGTGGNATEPAVTARTVGNATYDLGAIGTTVLQGGAAGARGGCNTGSVCGATGAGAGVVLVWFYRVTGAGTIEANGGSGGAAQLSAGIGAGGGGGGGGGRVVLLCHWIATSAPTLRALGGSGGGGAGIGSIGGSGQPGATELRMVA